MSAVRFIQRCLDAGMSVEMAMVAAQAFEAEMLVVAPPPSKAALRQRRFRDKRNEALQRNAGDACDAEVTVGDERVSPKEIPPTPPKEITPSQITPLEKPNGFSPPGVVVLRPEQPNAQGPPPKARATRLPSDWRPPDDVLAWAAKAGFSDKDVSFETDKFHDYWGAISGQRGTKLDWSGTFRNWLRNSNQPRGGGRAPAGPPNARRGNGGTVSFADLIVRDYGTG
jgi:hypothetical protein